MPEAGQVRDPGQLCEVGGVRKTKPNNGRQFNVGVPMNQNLLGQLDTLVEATGTSRAAVMRDALQFYRKQRKPEEWRAGLLPPEITAEINRLKAREQELLEESKQYLREATEARSSLNAALDLIEEMFE